MSKTILKLAFLILLINTVYAQKPCVNISTVSYSGKIYNTVEIGNQCWLKENLDIGTMIESNSYYDLQKDNGKIEKYCYNNNPANCNKYGGLYVWKEAMQYSTDERTQGICPDGWHIPTKEEFEILSTNAEKEAKQIVAIGEPTTAFKATNRTSFSALFAGNRYMDNGSFHSLNFSTFIWSSTEIDDSAYYLYTAIHESFFTIGNLNKSMGFSVRCIKD